MKTVYQLLIFQLLLELVGYSILLIVDWRICLAVFLMFWSANISIRVRLKEEIWKKMGL
jgi:hypothetical protein